MNGRLAPYLAQNQSLHHQPRRALHSGEHVPAWTPSLGRTTWSGGHGQLARAVLVAVAAVLAVVVALVDPSSAAALLIDGGTVDENP